MLTRKLMSVSVAFLMLAAGSLQAADAERGADLSSDCISCHGIDGKGTFESPKIAGLDQAYILKRLKGFSSGKTKSVDGIMHLYTEALSTRDLEDLAAYWASMGEY